MTEEKELSCKLREAFQRKRYGPGDYDPDFDLFEVAADALDKMDQPTEVIIGLLEACGVRRTQMTQEHLEAANRALRAYSKAIAYDQVG